MNFISQYFIHITFLLLLRYDERAGSYEDIRRSISSEENFQMARERTPGFPFPPFALGGLGGMHAFFFSIKPFVFCCENTFHCLKYVRYQLYLHICSVSTWFGQQTSNVQCGIRPENIWYDQPRHVSCKK